MAQDARAIPSDGEKSVSFARTFRETTVFKSERRAINKRRKVVAESMLVSEKDAWSKPLQKPRPNQAAPAGNGPRAKPPERMSDLVGVSLSGGGMRSASFSIGFLQKLGGSGLLRYIDYLSTVSGGGYAGAVLSANAYARGKNQKRRSHEELRRVICPFDRQELSEDEKKDKSEGQAPKLIQRLVYGGDYLFRDKFAFAARYCAGLVLNNVFMLSGVIVVAAALAILWRGFDAPYARQAFNELDKFSIDAAPSAGAMLRDQVKWYLAWLPKQLASYFDFTWNDDSIRPFFLVFCCIAFWLFAVLVQVLWWNTDYLMRRASPWRQDQLKAARDRRVKDTVLKVLCWIGVMAVLAISYWYDWLTVLGVSPDRDSTLIRVAVTGFVSLLALGPLSKWIYFGIERFHQVVLALILLSFLIGLAVLLGNRDIPSASSPWNWQNSLIPWGTLATLLLPFLKPNLIVQSATQPTNPAQRVVFIVASAALLVGGPLFCVFWIAREDFSRTAETRTVIKPYDFMELPDAAGGIKGFKKQLDADASTPFNGGDLNRFSHELATQLRSSTTKLPPEQDLATRDGKRAWQDALKELNEYISPNSLDPTKSETVPARLFVSAIENFDPRQFLQAVGSRFQSQKSAWAMMSDAVRQRFETYFDDFKKTALPNLLTLREKLNTGAPLKSSDFKTINELNRLLLSAWYPGFIRTRGFVGTNAVIEQDQAARACLFLYALCTFIVAGLLIDPNRTSIQQFYRRQLSSAFVASDHLPNMEDVELQAINTTAYGAPYHLLSGTANYIGLVAPGTAQRQEMFLFSRKFCGSRQLHYARTSRFLPRAYNSLGNAVAVSGAALSPTTVSQPLLFAVMMVLNLRLGQWLPNPRRLASRFIDGRWKSVPRLLPVIYGMTKEATDRSLCFVTDGGHRENLGVVQLLLRRCKLIIAVDAGQDPAHRFDDLARVLRSAEIHLGTKFYELDAEGRFTGRQLQSDELDLRTASHEARTHRWKVSDDERQEQRDATRCEEESMVSQHYLLARIVYPEQPQVEDEEKFNSPDEFNLLVYVKPSLTGDENELIEQYRAQNPDFPHEPTLDQDYPPAQFEAYRELGFHIGEEVTRRFAPVTAETDWWTCKRTVDVGELIDAFLERQWLLKKSSRLENDYASVLIKRVNNSNLVFNKRLEYARILRQLHGPANVMEGVRELAEWLKDSLAANRHRLLIELGPLAVLPVLALFRGGHTDTETRERCLHVLTSALLAQGPAGLDAAEYVPRVARELERFLIRFDEADELRNSVDRLLAELAKRHSVGQYAAIDAARGASATAQCYVGLGDVELISFDDAAIECIPNGEGVCELHGGGDVKEICHGVGEGGLRGHLLTIKDSRPLVTSFKYEFLSNAELVTQKETQLQEEYRCAYGEVPFYNRRQHSRN